MMSVFRTKDCVETHPTPDVMQNREPNQNETSENFNNDNAQDDFNGVVPKKSSIANDGDFKDNEEKQKSGSISSLNNMENDVI